MGFLRFLTGNFRWLSVGILLTFLSGFGQTYFISIFSGEIRAGFDLSHGEWGGIYTLGTGASAVVMLWSGGLTDRYRTRVLGAGVLVLLAAACLFMALNTWAALLPLVIFALRLTGQGMMSHLAVVSMSRWFIASRGRALSIAGLGFAMGEAILPVSFVSLMLLIDWRWLWVGAAAVSVAAIPLLYALLRQERTPQSHAESDVSFGMDKRHWTRLDALRHPLFWFMVPAILGPAAFNTAFFFQQVHFAEVKGWAHLDLVALFPLYTVAGFAVMLLSGGLLDRFGTPRLIPWYQLPMVAGFIILALAQTPAHAFVGLMFMAMTTGANATLPNAFWAEFYGTRHLGAVKATAASVMVLGSAIGPGITGAFIDLGIGIETQYLGVGLFFLTTTALMAVGVGRYSRTL
ncbi:MFS transporter [Tropicibacter oceani]|uniref:MFS transporter n=1 Tax=Tropicibacter oceani TaxID=3058420 RepID=A0ABY8QJF2_9RHOB|nr:MFS transporter [Tropicibacter oceani]WGW04573.1 MFS transporter [Tropicibacter oceani]